MCDATGFPKGARGVPGRKNEALAQKCSGAFAFGLPPYTHHLLCPLSGGPFAAGRSNASAAFFCMDRTIRKEPCDSMETEKPKPKARGRLDGVGRAKGTPNKNTKALKDMILQALDKAGGVDYLATQAMKNPKAFLALVGRVLPLQVNGPGEGGALLIQRVTRTIVDPAGNDDA